MVALMVVLSALLTVDWWAVPLVAMMVDPLVALKAVLLVSMMAAL